jgi:hypothetical protein
MQVCVTRAHEQMRLIIYNVKEMYTSFHPEMFLACTLNTVLWLEQQGHGICTGTVHQTVKWVLVGIFGSLRLKY